MVNKKEREKRNRKTAKMLQNDRIKAEYMKWFKATHSKKEYEDFIKTKEYHRLENYENKIRKEIQMEPKGKI